MSLDGESSVAPKPTGNSAIQVAAEQPISPERILLTLADQLRMARLYDKAIAIYDSVIQHYTTSDEAEAALGRIHYTIQLYNDAVNSGRVVGNTKDRFQYFQTIALKKANTRLELSALELSAMNAATQGDIQDAVTINQQIVSRWPDSDHEKSALASLAELYWRSGDKKSARLSLATLQSRHAGDPVTKLITDMGFMVEHFAGNAAPQNASSTGQNGNLKKEEAKTVALVPAVTGLQANYPNPFNPSTTMVYSVANPGNVKLFVFDILGRKVTELVNGFQNQGEHRIVFDGSSIASGVYFVRLEFEGKQFNRRLLLMK